MEVVITVSIVAREWRRATAHKVVGAVHEADGRYGVSFPDFPGCMAGGASLDEAMERGAAALAVHAGIMIEDGIEVPRIRSVQELRTAGELDEDISEGAIIVAVPVDVPAKAVRLKISMDEALLAALDRVAGQGKRSAFIAEAVRDKLKGAA